jgi:HEAT repeat protein
MLDSKQVKSLGLRFARALQTAIKTAAVFTIEHKSSHPPIQQSFLLLNNLLKEVGQLTFGFVDNQVLLNNLLTTDPTLEKLGTEFLKRGVAAVTFEPGLTLGRYKKVVHVLSAPVAAIEAAGGFLAFIDQNEIEGVRILPAAKNQKKTQDGDTILETDSESYILSKQAGEDQVPRDFLDSIDALLESGCFDPSTRNEVLSNFAAQGLDGSGYGVPVDVGKLAVVREGEVVAPASVEAGSSEPSGPGGGRALYVAAGQGAVAASGTVTQPGAAGVGRGLEGGMPAAAGAGVGARSIGYGDGLEGDLGAVASGIRAKVAAPGPSTFLELVQASVQRSLQEANGDPGKSYASLARILRNTGVDRILEQFPGERRQELSGLPPERLAAEYVEDTALRLAGLKLQSNENPAQKIFVEEQVVFLLGRTLQATHMADRLAQKLTKFIQDFAVPPHIQEKIREELHWTSLNSNKKYARLMEIKRFSNIEFRRLQEFLKELTTQRDMDRAAALVSHYFDFLDDPDTQVDTNELGRAPELMGSVPLAQSSFAAKTAERLVRILLRQDVSDLVHLQAANAITRLAQSIAAYENFKEVLAIAVSLQTSNNRDPRLHKKCCAAGLARLLPTAAIERLVELYLTQRNDSSWTKTTATLLRFAAPASIEIVFRHLVAEEDARNRLALVRLTTQLGSGTIEIASKLLEDARWYVVRNMCGVLAELKDPELVEHVAPALRHSDARVQQAALKALVKSRSAEAASVLAASLSNLAPAILDEALDELMFVRNASAVADLEQFIRTQRRNYAGANKAVRVLGAIKDDSALQALTRLFRMEELDQNVRKAALLAISNNPSLLATTLLGQLAGSWGPLAAEVRAELEKRKTKQ